MPEPRDTAADGQLRAILDLEDGARRDLALMAQRELDRRREVSTAPVPTRQREQELDLER